MNAAARYAREYLLLRPQVVVLRAPTGYLKTATTRAAAQRVTTSAILDCRELATAADVERALASRVRTAVPGDGAVDDLVVFENADAALGRPEVLAAIHAVLRRRSPKQTIAICARRAFALPAAVLDHVLELTHADLAVDVAAELSSRDLAAGRIEEIEALTLGWPMPTYRLASIAAAALPGVPLLACTGPALDRLLQDVRLDFVDRFPREHLDAEASDSLLGSHLARADGFLLRSGRAYRVPGIVRAAVEALPAAIVAVAPAPAPESPEVVFDVLSGEIVVGPTAVHLPRREFEVFVNLAIKGRHVPYDVLLEEVWGDADDDHAKLKVTVGRLRKRLGSATIRSRDAGYELGSNVTCTLAALEQLAAHADPLAPAILARLESVRERYRGGMPGAARNWPWYAAWSSRIEASVGRVLIALGKHAFAAGRLGTAVDRAREAIALDPVSQEAHQLALDALIAQGNVVAARQLATKYAATLDRTLGIGLPENVARIVYAQAS